VVTFINERSDELGTHSEVSTHSYLSVVFDWQVLSKHLPYFWTSTDLSHVERVESSLDSNKRFNKQTRSKNAKKDKGVRTKTPNYGGKFDSRISVVWLRATDVKIDIK
jgi:hypothetical protein